MLYIFLTTAAVVPKDNCILNQITFHQSEVGSTNGHFLRQFFYQFMIFVNWFNIEILYLLTSFIMQLIRSVILMLPVPPPPPPPPSMPKDTSYEIFAKKKHLAMLNGEQEFVEGSAKDEVASKYKQLFDKNQSQAKETEYPSQMSINITQYTHCPRCDRWLLKGEEQIHKSCHAAIIKQWLFLGDRFCSMSRKELIERLNVNYIVNGARELSNFLQNEPEHIEFIKLDLVDDVVQDPIPELKRAAQFIKMAHDKDGRVFVHCNVGRSRSVSAILVYMLTYQDISIQQGLKIIKQKRPIAQPNPNYMKRLLELQDSMKK